MAIAVRFRPLVPALLAVYSLTPLLHADEFLQPPQVPAPGSVGELFTPSPQTPPSPTLPIPTPPPPPPPAPLSPPPSGVVPLTPSGNSLSTSPLLESMKPGDLERRRLKKTDTKEWGYIDSDIIWRAPEPGRDTPFTPGEWSTEDLVAVPMVGPFYVFGGVEMGGGYSADQQTKVIGRTGLLWRLPVNDKSAIVVRGGPSVKYLDALHVEKSKDQGGAMLWEVKATAPPLLGPLGLEYLAEATPAMTPTDRSQVNSDLALYLPVSGGKLKLGAKHQWMDGKQQEARSAGGVMQWYLGLEIGR